MISLFHKPPNWISESGTYLITKLIPGVMGLVFVVVFIRMIGPEGYGRYAVIMALLMAIGGFSSGWLNQSVLRYYSKYEFDPGLLHVLFFGVRIALTVGIFVLLLSLIFLKPVGFEVSFFSITLLVLILISIILFRFYTTLEQTRLHPKGVVKLTSIQAVLSLIIPLVLMWVFKVDFKLLLLGIGIAFLLPSLPYLYEHYKKLALIKEKDTSSHKKILMRFIDFGYPLSLRMAVSLFIPFVDRFFINQFLGDTHTGLYSGFSDLVLRSYSILLFPVTLAVHPRLMSLWNERKKSKARKMLINALKLQTGTFLLLLTACLLFQPFLFKVFTILIPELQNEYYKLLIPLLLAGYLWQISLLIHKPLEMEEKPMLMLLGSVLALVITVVGNLVYLPKYGVLATAYTSITAGAFYCVFSLYLSRKSWRRNRLPSTEFPF